jgi:hypothetical protein
MIDSYSEVKVVLAPSGELLLALPIYANQNGALFDNDQLVSFTGDTGIPSNVTIGVYEKMGFMLYHPDQPCSIYMKSIDLFEDLGEL